MIRRGLRVPSRSGRLPAPVAVFTAAIACIVGAWALAGPETSGPDEPSHYVKALALSEGEWLGDPFSLEELQLYYSPLQAQQARRSNRLFDVPPGRAYRNAFPCHAFKAQVSASCLDADLEEGTSSLVGSGAGAYQPLHYLLPAVLSRLGTDRIDKVRLMRAGAALICVLLIGIAAWASHDRRRPALSLLGVALATTPMLLFLSGSFSPSGTEASASLAFVALLLRAVREEPAATPWWILAGVAGFVLALSRPEGCLFVAWGFVLAVGSVGPRRALAVVRLRRWGAGWLLLGAGGGTALSLAWSVAVGLSGPISIDRAVEVMGALRPAMRGLIQQQVGVFGWQDTYMPGWAYWTWVLLVLGLGGAALWRGARRERVLVAFTGIMSVALIFPLAGFIIDQYGFGMQGRYVLPASVGLPLVCAEVLRRRGPGRRGEPARRSRSPAGCRWSASTGAPGATPSGIAGRSTSSVRRSGSLRAAGSPGCSWS